MMKAAFAPIDVRRANPASAGLEHAHNPADDPAVMGASLALCVGRWNTAARPKSLMAVARFG
jgi:hypothetical protein